MRKILAIELVAWLKEHTRHGDCVSDERGLDDVEIDGYFNMHEFADFIIERLRKECNETPVKPARMSETLRWEGGK